ERVVAGTHEGNVVAPEAEELVVPVAADERVVPAAADEQVVACPAVLRELHGTGQDGGRDHLVVAAPGVEGERVGGPREVGQPHHGVQAGHPQGGEQEVDPVVPVGAVDDHGVGRAVGGTEVQVDGGDVGRGQVADGDRVGPAGGVDVDLLDA